ncbi:dihydroneopterin aldolase [Helicobacter cynogastricus]|uniref:dihydroneopterin aldolase n=1 Tax=Helicobacter cynogastricus TaxID=329937 RepID=UPI000CF1669A|nr:dihydroneopterin aldolase [Helicobacter cynogastricus]
MTLLIEDFHLNAIIGVQESEQEHPQPLIVNLEVDYYYSDLNPYLDYMDIMEVVQQQLSTMRYTLLEEALKGVSVQLKQRFPSIAKLTMSIKKPQACQSALVGARMCKNFERSEHD